MIVTNAKLPNFVFKLELPVATFTMICFLKRKLKKPLWVMCSLPKEIGFIFVPILLFFHKHTAGEGGGYSFNSSIPFPPDTHTLRH